MGRCGSSFARCVRAVSQLDPNLQPPDFAHADHWPLVNASSCQRNLRSSVLKESQPGSEAV